MSSNRRAAPQITASSQACLPGVRGAWLIAVICGAAARLRLVINGNRTIQLSPGAAGQLLSNQRGAALLAALLAAALVTTLAAAMIFDQQIDIRRSGNILHGDQARLYALGVEEWSALLLGRAKEGEEHEYIGRDLPPIMVEGGTVGGRLDDLQGLFNINNLVLQEGEKLERVQDHFRRLLSNCGLSVELEQAVSDWLDSDQEPRFPGGAEDGEYLRRSPPYRTANRPVITPTGLGLVHGFAEPAFAECLLPLLSALPTATALNVSTAPAEVLLGLAEGLDPGRIEQLVAGRPRRGYQNLSEFIEHPALAGSGLTAETAAGLLDVQSRYFMVQSEAAIGQSRVVIHGVLERQGEAVRLIRRGR